MMLPPVFAALSGDVDVAAIVDTRIYAHGEAPQDVTKPYVTWQLVTGVPENSLADPVDIDRCSLQVNCWHQDSKLIVTLATVVRAALEQYGYVTGVPINRREPETKLYWIAIDMDWLYHRSAVP